MAKGKKKKGGLLKLLVLLILIIGGLAAASHFYWDKVPRKYRDKFARNYAKVSSQVKALDIQVPDLKEIKAKLPEFDFLKSKEKKIQIPKERFALEELPPLPKVKTKQQLRAEAKTALPKAQKGERLYYVQVGQCIYSTCVRKLTKSVKRLGMPYKVKKKRNKETQFELISANSYRDDIAYAKLEKLERYNKMNFTPSLATAKGGQYRITFGQFAKRDQALQLSAYIRQLHLDINLGFVIVPKLQSYSTTAIYTGPFTSLFNAKNAAQALRGQEDFFDIKITHKL